MIYLNPDGFDPESSNLVRIQIENSLELGWPLEDIILVTDFPFEYEGVHSIIINKGFWSHEVTVTKVTGLMHLFDIGFISDKYLYWCHDLDAYQMHWITEEELGLDNFDLGLTDYCRKPVWQMGSFFLKKSSEDIFRANVALIKPGRHPITGGRQNDETAMQALSESNTNNINVRAKRLNNTYNFGMREIALCYERAIKPLKVLHFHPRNPIINTLAKAMYGRNQIGKPLMTERLIQLFHKFGYK